MKGTTGLYCSAHWLKTIESDWNLQTREQGRLYVASLGGTYTHSSMSIGDKKLGRRFQLVVTPDCGADEKIQDHASLESVIAGTCNSFRGATYSEQYASRTVFRIII